MKHKNWRVPRRNPTGTSEQQRALAGLIIQSRKEFKEEFGEEPEKTGHERSSRPT